MKRKTEKWIERSSDEKFIYGFEEAEWKNSEQDSVEEYSRKSKKKPRYIKNVEHLICYNFKQNDYFPSPYHIHFW